MSEQEDKNIDPRMKQEFEIISIPGKEIIAPLKKDKKTGRFVKGTNYVDVAHKKSLLTLTFLANFRQANFAQVHNVLFQKCLQGDLDAIEMYLRWSMVMPQHLMQESPTISVQSAGIAAAVLPTKEEMAQYIQERIKIAKETAAKIEAEKPPEDEPVAGE